MFNVKKILVLAYVDCRFHLIYNGIFSHTSNVITN